jgi:hypothetical protein
MARQRYTTAIEARDLAAFSGCSNRCELGRQGPRWYSDALNRRGRIRLRGLHDNLQITTGESRAFLGHIGIAGEIISTHGHSDDSMSLVLDEGVAFTGDLPPPSFVDERASAAGPCRALPASAPGSRESCARRR